jgi:hypothetical protein
VQLILSLAVMFISIPSEFQDYLSTEYKEILDATEREGAISNVFWPSPD